LSYSAYHDAGTPLFPKTYCNINGEIFEIPATTLNLSGRSAGDFYCIETDFSFDSAGTKIFEDTNTHETYQIRKAKLVLKTGFSVVVGTDIPVLAFDDSITERFYYGYNFDYFGRLADKLQILDIYTSQNNQDANIVSLQNSRNANESAWTTINGTTLFPKIYVNASSTPSNFASDVQLNSLGLGFNSASWLKFRKVGRTLEVSFSLVDMVLPTYTSNQVALINIDLNGLVPSFNNVLKFKSSAFGFEKDFDGTSDCCISGNVFQLNAHVSKPKAFYIMGFSPNQYSNFAINKSYNISSFPPTATTTLDGSNTKWLIEGSFTCEIN
jgi:hypothetical protein